MLRSNRRLWITRIAWVVFGFDLILALTLSNTPYAHNFFIAVPCIAWATLTLLSTSAWLILYYKLFFQTWLGWLIPQIVLMVSSAAIQNVLPDSCVFLYGLLAVLFPANVLAAIMVTIIFLWKRDVSLSLLAYWSLIIILAMLLSSRLQGNLFELAFFGLSHPDSTPLWWFNSIMVITSVVIPVGIISFIKHTIRLVLQELT